MPRMARRASRRRGLWRLLLLGVILFVLANYISPVLNYLDRTSQIEREQAITAELRSRHDQLMEERDRLQNNGYVEQVARRDLGLVRPGEQPFVVKDLDQQEGTGKEALPVTVEEPSFSGKISELLGKILP